MKSLATICLAALASLAAVSPAAATIVKRLSTADMTKRADVIVQGTVLRQTAAWNPEHTRIYTVTEIRVAESLKGAATPGSVVSIRQLGGVVDGTIQTIPGNAKFAAAEQVLVFLDKDETLPWHYVIGMAQGKLSVSGAGPAAQVRSDLADLAFVAPGPDAVMSLPAESGPGAPASLEAYKADIRAALRQP